MISLAHNFFEIVYHIGEKTLLYITSEIIFVFFLVSYGVFFLMFRLQYVDLSGIIDQFFLYLHTHVVVQECNTTDVNYTSTTLRG